MLRKYLQAPLDDEESNTDTISPHNATHSRIDKHPSNIRITALDAHPRLRMTSSGFHWAAARSEGVNLAIGASAPCLRRVYVRGPRSLEPRIPLSKRIDSIDHFELAMPGAPEWLPRWNSRFNAT
jgi:hypothetical protein